MRGKRVLLRVDLNVPLTPGGEVADDTRLRAVAPTIDYLADAGARIVLLAHLGRPEGAVVEGLRLGPVAVALQAVLGRPVGYTRECVGPVAAAAVGALGPGDIVLLENVRFHAAEEKNDPAFCQQLAALGDIYVNDGFGVSHRAHASTEGVAHLLPSAAGFVIEKEIEFLSKAAENPDRPYAAVVGGAKVSTKLTVLRHLLDTVDRLLIGGGMANTFIKAEGFGVGASRVEDDLLEEARRIMEAAAERKVRLLLPTDVVVADAFAEGASSRIVPVKAIPEGWQALDIGPQTAEVYRAGLRGCRTVFWNGPMGVFEMAPFAQGSYAVARAVAALPHCTTILGGGETAQLAQELGLAYTHVSTGGGATLEFLEGRVLPGIAALADA